MLADGLEHRWLCQLIPSNKSPLAILPEDPDQRRSLIGRPADSPGRGLLPDITNRTQPPLNQSGQIVSRHLDYQPARTTT
jgi:hypothetical protein